MGSVLKHSYRSPVYKHALLKLCMAIENGQLVPVTCTCHARQEGGSGSSGEYATDHAKLELRCENRSEMLKT